MLLVLSFFPAPSLRFVSPHSTVSTMAGGAQEEDGEGKGKASARMEAADADAEAIYSEACSLRVKSSLPLYHSKGQRCCRASHQPLLQGGAAVGGGQDEEVSCFPSFIIAGTQKSGTTALTGKT